MPITRRNLLKYAAISAVPAVLGQPARSMANTKLTGVIYQTPTYKAIVGNAHKFVDAVAKASDGKTIIDFYDSGKLVKADEQLPALRAGSIDLMFHTSSYISRSLPILGVCGMPGVVGSLYEHPERLYRGTPLFDIINKELSKADLYALSIGGIMEPEYLWSAKGKNYQSLEDLKGVKVRVTGYEATNALKAYGVVPIRISSSELYTSLQRGVVDAVVANVSTVVGRKLQEQLSSCYKLPITAYSIIPMMLRSRWDKLDGPVRDALLGGAKWYDENSHDETVKIFADYWKVVADAGVKSTEADKSAIDTFTKNSESIRQEWAKQFPDGLGEKALQLAEG